MCQDPLPLSILTLFPATCYSLPPGIIGGFTVDIWTLSCDRIIKGWAHEPFSILEKIWSFMPRPRIRYIITRPKKKNSRLEILPCYKLVMCYAQIEMASINIGDGNSPCGRIIGRVNSSNTSISPVRMDWSCVGSPHKTQITGVEAIAPLIPWCQG